MPPPPATGHRLAAATAIHRGDRAYQQDQVEILRHGKVPGCVLAVLADGMGGKSGGRKAADQVILTARQLFDRHVPGKDDPQELLRSLVTESHLMIKLTAITSEEEPHSTVAACLLDAQRRAHVVHAGDSRVYHFRRDEMQRRTIDHSFVQKLVDEGKITEDQALTHPQGNLLTGCLGTPADPPVTLTELGEVQVGDAIMACSDGLWHYYTPRELGAVLHSLPPREACEMLITRARQRARGGGDNLSMAVLKIGELPARPGR